MGPWCCYTEERFRKQLLGGRMRKNIAVVLLLAVAFGLPLAGCQDTKARQENEQLKARVAELVKENGGLGNTVDSLTQENNTLKKENEQLKAKSASAKSKKTAKKHHRHSSTR